MVKTTYMRQTWCHKHSSGVGPFTQHTPGLAPCLQIKPQQYYGNGICNAIPNGLPGYRVSCAVACKPDSSSDPAFNGANGAKGADGTGGSAAAPGAPTTDRVAVFATGSLKGAVGAAGLRLWLSSMQVHWLAGDMDTTKFIFNALISAGNCTDQPADCADIWATLTKYANYMQHGLDVYGQPRNWWVTAAGRGQWADRRLFLQLARVFGFNCYWSTLVDAAHRCTRTFTGNNVLTFASLTGRRP